MTDVGNDIALEADPGTEAEAGRGSSGGLERLSVRLLRPERRWLFGSEQFTPQNGVALPSGGRVWLYRARTSWGSSVICRIRPYRDDDAGGLYEAVRESITELSRWLPWCHADYSMQESIEWATLQARQAAERGPEVAFAVVGPGDEFLGGCGVNQVNPIHRFGNLGYWVRTSATGRGVAREAARQMAEFAFRNTDLVRLEIVCAVENRRSQRVAEAVGATREGVLRNRLRIREESFDAVMYSLVRPSTT